MDIIEFISVGVVPLATAGLGWLGNAYRNKQKKESDIMSNFEQMLRIQNDFIDGLKKNIDDKDKALQEESRTTRRLVAKLDQKDKIIRKANLCKFSNEGDGCPVIRQEEEHEKSLCKECKHIENDDTSKN